MNVFRRVAVVAFLLIILLAGALFWPFIFGEIIRPVAQAVWVLLRVFVLSIDQSVFWVAIILMTAFLLLRRLLFSTEPTAQPEGLQRPNTAIENIQYWHSLLDSSAGDPQDDRATKKQLAQLLLQLFATRRRTSADFRLYDALQQGEIPLPEDIHAFLFAAEPQQAQRPLKRFLHSLRTAPQKWLRRRTGQEKADYYRSVDDVLTFVETSLEIKDDDGNFTPNRT